MFSFSGHHNHHPRAPIGEAVGFKCACVKRGGAIPCSEMCVNVEAYDGMASVGHNYQPYSNTMVAHDDQGWVVPFTQAPTFKGPLFLNVESARRDKTIHPYSFSFALNLPGAINGVSSIELVEFSMPTLKVQDAPAGNYFYLGNGLISGFTPSFDYSGFTLVEFVYDSTNIGTVFTYNTVDLSAATGDTPSSVDDFYVGKTLQVTGGPSGANVESVTVFAYDGTTKIATVTPNFSSTVVAYNNTDASTDNVTVQIRTPTLGDEAYGNNMTPTQTRFEPQNLIRMHRTMVSAVAQPYDVARYSFGKLHYHSQSPLQTWERDNWRRVCFMQPEIERLSEIQFSLVNRLTQPLPLHKLVLDTEAALPNPETPLVSEDEWSCTLMVTCRAN